MPFTRPSQQGFSFGLPDYLEFGILNLLDSIPEIQQMQAMVSAPWILNGATAGQDSGWIPYIPGMRLAYALDSGSTSTNFSVDASASSDGSTLPWQAFTGTWSSSSAYEISPPIYLSNQAARFIRFNVLTGGPLSVRTNV